VRADRFGSEQSPGPRRLSALASGPGSVHGPNTGPLSSVGYRGEMGHRGPSREAEPCLLLGRAAGAARATGSGARPLCWGPAGLGGGFARWAWRSGMRRGVRKTAERRAAGQFGPVPTWRLRLSGRLVRVDEAREYRLNNRGRMELIQAVQEQDVEKVKVRRLLETVYSTESGPSRAVCLGLGQ
jgi:hypothetical protein